MVTFLLLVKSITAYSKNDIDKGKTPLEIYKLCSCIREAFCLSYSIRKNNILYLYFQKEYLLIQFKGENLRYLGPDERSQALLLKKAIYLAKQDKNRIYKDWMKSTPGIYVRGFKDNKAFFSFLKSISMGNSYLIMDNETDSITFSTKNLGNLSELLFIMPTYTVSSEFFELLQNLKTIMRGNLSKIERIENKILYINFQIDHQIYNDS